MPPKFRNDETERVYQGEFVRKFSGIAKQAQRKITSVIVATSIYDLSAIPGNRYEKLHGDREGQHSIRVNDQYRVVFEWIREEAFNIELVDYH